MPYDPHILYFLSSSVSQLTLVQVLTGMKLRVVPTRPALGFGGDGMPEILEEMYPAGKGILGQKSIDKWSSGEAKESVEKGFDELIGLMEIPFVPPPPRG